MKKYWYFFTSCLFLLIVTSQASARIGYGPLLLDDPTVLNKGAFELKTQLGFGSGDINLFGLQPFSFRYGLLQNLELGIEIPFESNDEDSKGFIPPPQLDNSGLEHIALTAKYRFIPELSGEFTLGFAGSNKILHGSDGVDLRLRLAYGYLFTRAALFANLGYNIRSGELAGTKLSYEDILSVGLGYSYSVKQQWSLNAELLYESKSLKDRGLNSKKTVPEENALELVGGTKYKVTPTLDLDGGVGVGLSDGAPDFRLFFGLTKEWGRGGGQRLPPKGTKIDITEYHPDPVKEMATRVNNRRVAEGFIEEGNRSFAAEKFDEAYQLYLKAANLDPRNYLSFYNAGVALYRLGRYEESVGQYQKALEIQPDDIDTYLSLALSHYKMGMEDRAIEAWKKVLEFSPTNLVAQKNLKTLGVIP